MLVVLQGMQGTFASRGAGREVYGKREVLATRAAWRKLFVWVLGRILLIYVYNCMKVA